MAREEIETLVFAVGLARPVAGTGDDQEIEILVVLYELVDDLVIANHRFALAVGGQLRLGAVDVGFAPHRTREPAAAAASSSASGVR